MTFTIIWYCKKPQSVLFMLRITDKPIIEIYSCKFMTTYMSH
nr:MAG TPA: hypothetical protein [Caudoviricetes sp.]